MPGMRSLLWLVVVTLAYLAALPLVGSLDMTGRESAALGAILTLLAGAISASWWSVVTFPAVVFLAFAVPAILFRPDVDYRDEGGVAFQVAMSVFVSLMVFALAVAGCTAAALARRTYSQIAGRRRRLRRTPE